MRKRMMMKKMFQKIMQRKKSRMTHHPVSECTIFVEQGFANL
jgi:hypothetical protein